MSRRAWAMCSRSLLIAAATATVPGPAAGQSLRELASMCTAGAPSSASACLDGAVAARALLGHLGLLAGVGAEVPGSWAALGRRAGAAPRWAASLRAAGLNAKLPDVTDRVGNPRQQADFFVPAMHGSLVLGVFDGFRFRPTVGGFLALDFVGQTSMLFLPKGQGFSGRVGSLSIGARVGILRETFTLPGISLSVSHRLMGTVSLGNAPSGDPAAIRIEPSVTAFRATIGKDLFALGVMAGAGWDRYHTDASLTVSDPTAGVVEIRSPLSAGRALAFGGLSYSLLILQLSTEVGWARGFSGVQGYTQQAYDPTAGTVFGSFAGRLTIG